MTPTDLEAERERLAEALRVAREAETRLLLALARFDVVRGRLSEVRRSLSRRT